MNLKDLKNKWNSLTQEQKVLVGLAVVVLCVVFYAYHPFTGAAVNNTTQNQDQPQSADVVTVPFQQAGSNNSTVSNNTTTSNATITSDEAKNIAEHSQSGYTAGDPTQGSINVDGTETSVWIVPLSKNNAISKTLYIDANTGKIVQET
jgi:uncharacterized membrane protein YkoI